MIDLSRNSFKHLSQRCAKLKNVFSDYLDNHIKIPSSLLTFIFPPDFFDSVTYLVFPDFFKKAFKAKESFSEKLCISGFLYFKYLLSADDLIDNDSIKNSDIPRELKILKAHTYHQESLKLLAGEFGNNKLFWELWSKRNNEFLKSILLDKQYNPEMTFETYAMLSMYKCSFSKVAVDAYFSKTNSNAERELLYNNLVKSIDFFSIARCIQDDIEDFSKDLHYKKNNLGHILLQSWLKDRGKKLSDYPIETLEKLLFTSELSEKLLSLSKEYYQKAIDIVPSDSKLLEDYLKMLESLRNNVNHFKVNIQAYRVDKYITQINSVAIPIKSSLTESIELSDRYISNMQDDSGSWFEISNMQGLSNVWATGFISFLLPNESKMMKRASDFLRTHTQDGLWGYNTDWTYDFDSTTAALLSLNNAGENTDAYVTQWLRGQRSSGGFSTYSQEQHKLFSNLGLKKNDVRGWLHEHTCVSALAYYFLSSYSNRHKHQESIDLLRSFLMSQRNSKGVWSPYWWTSHLYPTSFVLQGMMNEENPLWDYIELSINSIIRQQNNDGSFSCDVLKNKSVFYTALVLDTICASELTSQKYKRQAVAMKDWILSQQYSNGHFMGSDFLVMPNPNVVHWKPSSSSFKLKRTGGGNTITGEIASLFSTAISYRALSRFFKIN